MSTADRYVLLGLAGVRARWFTEVARWATAGVIPAEFVRCISAEEVRARLASGRSFSVLLVDADALGFDRDMVDLARRSGCPTVVVGSPRPGSDWAVLGTAASLPPDFGRPALLDALATHAAMVAAVADVPGLEPEPPLLSAWRGELVAVTGSGGTGASTVAAALAQGFAADVRQGGLVVLADLALDADQAMLHDAGDVVPGVQELVEAHQLARPPATTVRAHTFEVPQRGYRLLLGLRRHQDWSALRPRAVEAALDNLRATFRVVVADIEPDFEGDHDTGSVEVEERNVLARTAAHDADAVLAVGTAGLTGVHGLVRTLRKLHQHGVDPERVIAVLEPRPRSPRARSELSRTLADLLPEAAGPIVHLPDRRGLENTVRDGARLPEALCAPVAAAARATLNAVGAHESAAPEPVLVAPGSLGSFTDQELQP